MAKQSPILLTGGAGYIGSVLTRRLLARGHQVRVLDNLKFGGDSLLELLGHPRFEFQKGDVRDKKTLQEALKGVKKVIHLAAIVGDPACKLFADEARSVNTHASAMLLKLSLQSGVNQFVFASTCSNYGVMQHPGEILDENAALNPQSEYAEQKTGFEQLLMGEKSKIFHPTVLRFATVYGPSPRMRFDLSLNHFTRDLFAGKKLEVTQKDSWRPYCHVRDLARSVVSVIERRPSQIPSLVYNVGASSENYTKEMLVSEILKRIPEAEIAWLKGRSDDPRNYRVDFTRISRELNFRVSRKVPHGIEEIIHLLNSGLLGDPFHSRYCNT